MPFAYDNVMTSVVVISDPTGDQVSQIFRVPERCTKIEILAAWAVSDTTTTLGNGTGIALRLLDYGNGGTAVAGTVSASLGGTTITWTTNVPKTFTISEGTMDSLDYLMLSYDETGTIAPINITVGIDYVIGVGA